MKYTGKIVFVICILTGNSATAEPSASVYHWRCSSAESARSVYTNIPTRQDSERCRKSPSSNSQRGAFSRVSPVLFELYRDEARAKLGKLHPELRPSKLSKKKASK